jgi:anti-sigma factor RsiW
VTSLDDGVLFDLADGALAGPEWEAWLADNPEAAAEVALARRVRGMLRQLSEEGAAVPAGFEQRLLRRVREDAALRDLLDLGLSGIGHVLLDLLMALLGPAAAAQPAAAS